MYDAKDTDTVPKSSQICEERKKSMRNFLLAYLYVVLLYVVQLLITTTCTSYSCTSTGMVRVQSTVARYTSTPGSSVQVHGLCSGAVYLSTVPGTVLGRERLL